MSVQKVEESLCGDRVIVFKRELFYLRKLTIVLVPDHSKEAVESVNECLGLGIHAFRVGKEHGHEVLGMRNNGVNDSLVKPINLDGLHDFPHESNVHGEVLIVVHSSSDRIEAHLQRCSGLV